MKYKVYALNNFRTIPQINKNLNKQQQRDIEIAGNILPFKVNNYVVDELIDWSNWQNDPIFNLTFPRKEMIRGEHFKTMGKALDSGNDAAAIKKLANNLRLDLNPHPAGQMEHNVPEFEAKKLTGIQHKYDQTVLFFPKHGQTCHAYCTFCFRWPQFTGMDEFKFAMHETELLIKYLKAHPEVTDLLLTGGDPMIMTAKKLRAYIEPILKADIPHLQTIRIGTKALGYWPYRFLTDNGALDTLKLFEEVKDSGRNLAVMAHFNHPVELKTEAVQEAIRLIRYTGASINAQSPIMEHINAEAETWAEMWKLQVKLGTVPYYMFIARNTGAQSYFAVSLDKAWNIYKNAYKQVGGIARTVRGPSMSAFPGKVQILGSSLLKDEKVYILRFIQARDPEWVATPFYAQYDPNAIWLTDLKPAFGASKFFFEN